MTVSGVFKPASAGLGLATSRRHPAGEDPGGGTVHVIREEMLGGRRPVRDLVTARSTSSARVRAYFDEGRNAFEPGAGSS